MSDYDYIARYYGIRPRYGERIRLSNGQEGVVKRERKRAAHYVAIQPDGAKHVIFEHPMVIEYLDRETESDHDDQG